MGSTFQDTPDKRAATLHRPNTEQTSKLYLPVPRYYGRSLDCFNFPDQYRHTELVHVFRASVSAIFRSAMSSPEQKLEAGVGRPLPPTGQAFHPITVPIPPPHPTPTNRTTKHYCCNPSSPTAVFCGMRKSLREILSSKHTSSMYSLVPMMYSQADLFYSPRARRHDGENDTGGSPAVPGSGVASAWKGLNIEVAPNPKAHLHFNSAVRQAVEKYSDVLSSLKCHHMDDIIREVMRLCPLLRNDVTVKNKVRRAVKSYICNAVTHYKRKQRNKTLGNADTSRKDSTAFQVHGPSRQEASSPDVEDFFGGASSSYQDELIYYSQVGHGVPVTIESVPPQENAVQYAHGQIPSSSNRTRLSVSSAESNPHPHTNEVMENNRQHHSDGILKREVDESQHIEISDVRSISTDEDNCVASSGEDERGFRFSDGPSMEELRAVQADFAKQRDWDQFHQPRNLLLAMVGEVGEVSEIFQWRGECKEGLEDWSEKDKKHLGQELSDVLMYLIRLAEKCHVDLPSAAMDKLGLNAKKYPAQKVYGSSKKYDEYD